MKLFLRFLLVLVLGWGLWALLGSDADEAGPEIGDDSYLDEDPDGGGSTNTSLLPMPSGTNGPRTVEAAEPSGADAAGRDDADGLALHGRVVDGRRLPIPEAQIELRMGGRTLVRASTDVEGHYRLNLTLPPGFVAQRAEVLARRDGFGVGLGTIWLATVGSQTVAAIVLEKAHHLRVRVDIDGKPSPFGPVAVAKRAGGLLSPLGVRPAGSDGHVVFDGLGAGLYEIYATLPGRGRGMVRARLPQADGEVAVVSLGAERTLAVIVEDAHTGRPVAGAVVTVGDKSTLPVPTGPGYLPPLAPLTTDQSGRVTVRGLGGEETLYANAEAPGYVPGVWWRASGQVARPGTHEVRVRLQRYRTVTFPLYVGDAGAPDEGTPLRVESASRTAHRGASTARGRVGGAYVVVEGLAQTSVTGVLVAPDGRQARFSAPTGTDAGNALEFVSARSVRVRVVEPDGAPVEGLALRLSPLDGLARVAPATTDADGIAVFEGVASQKAGVHVRVGDSPWGGPLLGRIDLADGNEEYEFELQTRLGFRLVLRVDGEAALPGHYSLVVGGQRVPLDEITEDARAGLLDVSVRPPAGDGELRGMLHASGFLPTAFVLDPREADGREIEIDLRTAGRIVARVIPPEDGRYSLGLQRYDPAEATWRPVSSAPGPGLVPEPSGDGVHAFEGLDAGRYRVVELRSGFESRPVNLVLGAQPPALAVDLSGALELQGRVLAPAGTNFALARVLVEGRHAIGSSWAGIRVGADGSFTFRALRGERLQLRVTHPTLAAASSGGAATVTAGGARVELRLEPGAQATFRVVGFEQVRTPGTGVWHAPVQVKLYQGKVGGELVHAVQPVAAAGVFTFGGFKPGTYSIWIGLGTKHAPFTRAGVSLTVGATDLGTITPSTGTTLTIELDRDAAAAGVSVWANLTALGEPSYVRSASTGSDRSTVTVAGLGKGTFRLLVRASTSQGTRILHEAEITLTGTGERRIRVGGR